MINAKKKKTQTEKHCMVGIYIILGKGKAAKSQNRTMLRDKPKIIHESRTLQIRDIPSFFE
jgi:hypothetical protein